MIKLKELQSEKLVIKYQLHAGGRGKAEGVKLIKNAEDLIKESNNMFGKILITHQTGPEGKEVKRLYIEEASDIKKEFNFQTGSGVAQFDLKNIFTKKDCKEIYNKFGSNLNWIIRDSQHLILPNSQLLYAKKIKNFMINFCEIVQKNIPEKNLIKLKIETLRVARSDGTQHQVGARWHQDHEAYFSLLINLNDYADPMASTRFYHLKHNEKYN